MRSPSPLDQTLLQWRRPSSQAPADRISPQTLRERMICEQSSQAGRSLLKASKFLGAEGRVLLHPQPLSFPHPLIEYNPLLDVQLQEVAQPAELLLRPRGKKPYCRFRAAQRCRRSGTFFEGRPCDCRIKHERRPACEWGTTPCEDSRNHTNERVGRPITDTKIKFVEGEVSEVKIVQRWIEQSEYPESEEIDIVDYAVLLGIETEADILWAETVETGTDEDLPFLEDEDNWLGDQELKTCVMNLDEKGVLDGIGTLDLGLS